MNFIPRNEGFVCEACGTDVPPAANTFRNHCPHCLASKHVDGAVPGDRAADCGGLMPAIAYEGTDPDTVDLVQQCRKCGHIRKNRRASDDTTAAILDLHI